MEALSPIDGTPGLLGEGVAGHVYLPQIKYETFLEDVNNILTSGEVPNLFPKDELTAVLDELRPAAKAAGAGETQEQLAAFFMERVR